MDFSNFVNGEPAICLPSRVNIWIFDAASELCLMALIVEAPAVIVAAVAKSPEASDNVKLPELPDAKIPRLSNVVFPERSSPKLRYFAISEESSQVPEADVSDSGLPVSVLNTSP